MTQYACAMYDVNSVDRNPLPCQQVSEVSSAIYTKCN